MQHIIRNWTGILLTAASVSIAACGGGRQQNTAAGDVNAAQSAAQQPSMATPTASPTYTAAPVDTVRRTHHSKLKGALVGAVVGHYAGHHALAGAAAGAMVQHERNKHP
jgi:hypothetical protein